MNSMDLAKTLSYNYMFRGVPRSTVAYLAAAAQTRRVEGGEVLVRQFDRSDDILVILEGEAVTKTMHGDVLAAFGPGSVIGEMALLDGEARSATVVSKGAARVAVLRGDDIRSAMETDPIAAQAILENLAKVLCRRLRTMNAQMESGAKSFALV
jgi:CRP-like cAMP-binding protein